MSNINKEQQKSDETQELINPFGENTLYVCYKGCCCGKLEKNNVPVNNSLYAELMKSTGLNKNFKLKFKDCLGPCKPANIVKLRINNQFYWFKHINSDNEIKAIFDFLKNPEQIPLSLIDKQAFF